MYSYSNFLANDEVLTIACSGNIPHPYVLPNIGHSQLISNKSTQQEDSSFIMNAPIRLQGSRPYIINDGGAPRQEA